MDELLDREEIRDVLLRYCRGVDRCDEELVRSVYHEDATDDHGTFKGSGHEFASVVVPMLRAQWRSTVHALHNVSIDLDGDAAFVESGFVATHRSLTDQDPTDFVFGGRYIDRFECRDGVWKIASRLVVHDWSRLEPVGTELDLSMFEQGRQDQTDPSYRRL